MILEDIEITHILNQTHAVHKALLSIERLLLEHHLLHTFPDRIDFDKQRAVNQLTAVFRRKIL